MNYRFLKFVPLAAVSSILLFSPLLAKSASAQEKEQLERQEIEDQKGNLLRGLNAKFSEVLTARKNKSDSFDTLELELSEMLAKLESLNSLELHEEYEIGKTLNQLANLHSPLPGHEYSFGRRNLNYSAQGCDDANFEKGIAFKKREFALHNKLHSDVKDQVRNRRALLNWYLDRGHKEEGEEQLKLLSEMLHSNDPNYLNPPRATGCGQPNQDDGDPRQDQSFTNLIGCGMG